MSHTAVLLVGVQHAGSLTPLQAVPEALSKMHEWAKTQTTTRYIRRVCDFEGDEVRASAVQDAADELLNLPDVSRLVIYFCGHGIVVGTDEFWLLSRAPKWGSEAINVGGTAKAGQSLQIPHIVLISDACRLLTTHVQGAAVGGTVILPTTDRAGARSKVDKLYACALGAAAYEVPTPDGTGYAAVYTDVLALALRGEPALVVDWSHTRDGSVVRPRALEEYLPTLLIERLEELKAPIHVHQQPDAEVLSGAHAWLSKLGSSPNGVEVVGDAPAVDSRPTLRGLARRELDTAIELVSSNDRTEADFVRAVESAQLPVISLTEHLSSPTSWQTPSDEGDWSEFTDAMLIGFHSAGRVPFDTALMFGESAPHELGLRKLALVQFVGVAPRRILVRGREEQIPVPLTSLTSDETEVFSVLVRAGESWWPTPALVQLEDGGVFALPLTSGAVTRIDASEGSLHSISYALSDRQADDAVMDAVLRDAVARASAQGVFHPAEEDLDRLLTAMRIRKDVDPSLALYVAYALSDRDRQEELADMRYLLKLSTGYDFFDLAMLNTRADDRMWGDRTQPDPPTPPYPLLSQGWPLLPVLARSDDRSTQFWDHLRPMRRQGLWTSFSQEAWDLLDWIAS